MTSELASWAHCSTRSSSGSTMPRSIYSTEPTWAGSATSESIWDSGRKIIGSEAADALEVEARIAARRGDGKSHPCLGRPLPTSSGGRRRIPGGDPDGPLVRNARASSDPVCARGTLARRYRGVRAVLHAVSAPDSGPRPRLDPLDVCVLGRSAAVPSRPRFRPPTSRLARTRTAVHGPGRNRTDDLDRKSTRLNSSHTVISY